MESGTTTRDEAERLFLGFLENADLIAPRVGYRIDTWQIWPTCDGNHTITPERPYGCTNPGIFITIDDDPREPFVAMLGPWELMRSSDLMALYVATITSLVPVVMTASFHLHLLGFPCHDACTSCEEPEDNDDVGPMG